MAATPRNQSISVTDPSTYTSLATIPPKALSTCLDELTDILEKEIEKNKPKQNNSSYYQLFYWKLINGHQKEKKLFALKTLSENVNNIIQENRHSKRSSSNASNSSDGSYTRKNRSISFSDQNLLLSQAIEKCPTSKETTRILCTGFFSRTKQQLKQYGLTPPPRVSWR